jgi:hypothetical protein
MGKGDNLCDVSLGGAFTGSGTQKHVFSSVVLLVLAHSAVNSAVNFSEVKVLILKLQPMLRWVDHYLTV